MSNPSQQWIVETLQIMTPDKVAELTLTVEHRKASLPMAAGAEGEEFFETDSVPEESYQVEASEEAKIIPITAKSGKKKRIVIEEEVEEEEVIETPSLEDTQIDGELEQKIISEFSEQEMEMLQQSSSLESVGIVNSQKQKLLNEINHKKKKAKEESATVFVLKEREKLKDSTVKLATQDAIKSYKKSSTQDSKQKYDEEGKSIVGSSGILVNKKHY